MTWKYQNFWNFERAKILVVVAHNSRKRLTVGLLFLPHPSKNYVLVDLFLLEKNCKKQFHKAQRYWLVENDSVTALLDCITSWAMTDLESVILLQSICNNIQYLNKTNSFNNIQLVNTFNSWTLKRLQVAGGKQMWDGFIRSQLVKLGGLDVETNRDRDRERPSCRD